MSERDSAATRDRRRLAAVVCLATMAFSSGCNTATLRLPAEPVVPGAVQAPAPPQPTPAADRYVPADPKVESQAVRGVAGAHLAIAPTAGREPAGLRAALLKVLLKGGLRVRDLDGAGRVLAGYRRAGPGTSTDFYGLFDDVMRVAPSTVGGVVVWPEVVELRERTVPAGGAPTYPPRVVAEWRGAVERFEADRADRLSRLDGEVQRYKQEFQAAWAEYTARRNFFQEANDGVDGPAERRAFEEILGRAEAAARAMRGVQPPALDAASANREPETLRMMSARFRLTVCDARTGEVMAVHEIEAEAPSADELNARIAVAAGKALGVKR